MKQVGDLDWPIPPEMTIQECADWPGEPNTQEVTVEHSFQLPISSDLLFLVARGPLANGQVNIVQSEDQSDRATVTVQTTYDEQHLLDLVKICSLVAKEGENGVGIFSVRPRPRHSHRIRFEITVTFPKGSENSPLLVSGFRTEMKGVFGHRVEADSVSFNSISLQGALRPIQVDSLTAGSAHMATANSAIEGNFTVHKSLTLSTANAPIDVAVTMLSEKAGETDLKMSTANSHIGAALSLITRDSEEESPSASVNGTFNIEANTARGAINVTFPTAPVRSAVHLLADTSLAGVDIVMDPTYEGTFAVHSTPFDKATITAEDKEDPEGKDRKRNLVFNSIGGGNADGNVYWGEGEGKDRGSIKVNTALGHVSLEL